ncbi:MAG TPA: hypothetical protein V6C65_26295 [Allocoleopsis sp.]
MANPPRNMSPEDAALLELMNAGNDFIAGGPAVYNTGVPLNYEDLSPDQLAKLGPSAMQGVSTDPRYRDAQVDSLNQLDEISRTGMNARDEADLLKLRQDVNRTNRGRQGAIQQNMASRGMSGSGMDLVAQMSASQDATEREALAALEKNAQIGERKQNAMMQRGQLATGYRDQDFGEQARKAAAADEIARFNTANSVNAQFRNNQGRNDTNSANWQRTNQTSDRNTQANYDFRKDKYGVQQTGAEFKYNKATEDWNRAQMKKARQRNRFGNMFSGAVQGASAGSTFGPWGAAAGAVTGAAANYAKGGRVDEFDVTGGFRVPGQPQFPFDTEADDTVPAMLSPGEIVIPKTAAQDPTTAAAFAASVAEPQDQFSSIKNPMVRDYMRSKMQARKEMDEAEQNQKYLGAANMAGKVITDALNNKQEDVILKNRLSDLGRAPGVIEAKRNEWDGSFLDKMGQQGVNSAQNKMKMAKEDFGESMTIDRFNRETDAQDRALAKEKASNDPNSEESKAAREYLKTLAPGVAEKMGNFNTLTAAQIEKRAPGLFDKYKADAAERSADKRLQYQIGAEDRRAAKALEKENKDMTYKFTKTYQDDDVTKRTTEIRMAKKQAENLAANPSPTNDISLVFAFMRSNDPRSTVREGEYAMAAQAGGLPQKFQAMYEQAKKGELPPEARANMLKTIQTNAESQEASQTERDAYYAEQARFYKVDPELVIGKKIEPAPSSGNPGQVRSAADLP